jgi:hypothetical protein
MAAWQIQDGRGHARTGSLSVAYRERGPTGAVLTSCLRHNTDPPAGASTLH